MALSANIGIIASNFILPNYGWGLVFIFFGFLTLSSAILLAFFNERPAFIS